MKKLLAFFLAVGMMCSIAGCSLSEDILSAIQPQEKLFLLEDYDLQIVADSTFADKTGGSFDLQITNDNAYISLMAYPYIDLPEGVTPLDVLELQNDDITSKRDNVAVVEERKTQAISQGEVVYMVYSAQKDGVKNYYATYLVDFPEAEICVWVLVTATPSYYTSNTDYLHNIVCSLSPTS